ncbi:MAG: hypothetical protein GDA36_06460 [Rhodobacteraceae bacterium]|nr:hypothetical protein [Paracoccaceae bacterium]
MHTAETSAKKKKNPSARVTLQLNVEPEVYKTISNMAKTAEMNIQLFVTQMIEKQLVANAGNDNPVAARIQAKHALDEPVIATVKQMVEAGEFDEHFILRVFQKLRKDQTFLANYEAASRQQHVSLNRHIVILIKSAAKAKNKKGEDGEEIRFRIKGELITSYTLLEKKG